MKLKKKPFENEPYGNRSQSCSGTTRHPNCSVTLALVIGYKVEYYISDTCFFRAFFLSKIVTRSSPALCAVHWQTSIFLAMWRIELFGKHGMPHLSATKRVFIGKKHRLTTLMLLNDFRDVPNKFCMTKLNRTLLRYFLMRTVKQRYASLATSTRWRIHLDSRSSGKDRLIEKKNRGKETERNDKRFTSRANVHLVIGWKTTSKTYWSSPGSFMGILYTHVHANNDIYIYMYLYIHIYTHIDIL